MVALTQFPALLARHQPHPALQDLQRLFDTQALSPFQLAAVLLASTAAFVAVEIEKWLIRRRSRRSRRATD